MSHPSLIRREARVGAELGAAHRLGEGSPMVVGWRGNRDEAVCGSQESVWAEQRMGVALRLGRDSGDGVLVDDALGECEHRIGHGDIDELALAGPGDMVHGREDAAGRQHCGEDVSDTGADLHRVVDVGAGDAHEARHRLRDDVEGRPVGVRAEPGSWVAEAPDARIDEPGVACVQDLVGEAEPVHDADPEVLDEDVGFVDEGEEGRDVAGGVEVQAGAALVSVDACEIAAIGGRAGGGHFLRSRCREWSPCSGHITLRRFDFQDIRAHVGE